MLLQQEELSSKAPLIMPLYPMASVFQRLMVLWEQRVIPCGQRTLQPCFPCSPPHLPVSVPWKSCNLLRLSALHRQFFARPLLCDFFSGWNLLKSSRGICAILPRDFLRVSGPPLGAHSTLSCSVTEA